MATSYEEWDNVVSWVLHSDGADSFCMVSKSFEAHAPYLREAFDKVTKRQDFHGVINPCSHGGRALVMKGAKEMENTWQTPKYQDNA
ncbi:hypothetical protein B296_00020653 [Ensete ventricosum]|uniref:Uncharacterized protein n=1 Tax=Ensete ventricosum TaxID=4639 RepID=A0A426Y821_ENSVE|nr:hypothetical protein B296_00020653 [Ensete ventricosum]